jgi:hypothetical protein
LGVTGEGKIVPDPASLTISILALATSAGTAWFTLFRRGRVRMTQPTVVYFGPDGNAPETSPAPKVFFRTLLYSTAKRGRIIESMYVKLRRGETVQTFNIWVYGEEKLSRGSGLFVGYEGVTFNHHFLLPADGTTYSFLPGNYKLEVYASLVGTPGDFLIGGAELQMSESIARALQAPKAGVYFDWGPDSATYCHHIRGKSERPLLPSHAAADGISDEVGLARAADLISEGNERNHET